MPHFFSQSGLTRCVLSAIRVESYRNLSMAIVLTGMVSTWSNPSAQEFTDIKPSNLPPLVLRSEGSFTVDGVIITAPDGTHIPNNQMYVQYKEPLLSFGVPVVMIYGAGLSAKTYETTPDGRMGWEEYFVRNGFPAFLAEQVSRARSGFNPTVFQQVLAGTLPPSTLPFAFEWSIELGWPVFRFGPSAVGIPYADEQFPVQAVDSLLEQGVPDLNALLPAANPTWKALSDLGRELNGAVIISHSESGSFRRKRRLSMQVA